MNKEGNCFAKKSYDKTFAQRKGSINSLFRETDNSTSLWNTFGRETHSKSPHVTENPHHYDSRNIQIYNNNSKERLKRGKSFKNSKANKSSKKYMKTPKSIVLISSSKRREKSMNLSQIGSPTKKSIDLSPKQRAGSQLEYNHPNFEFNEPKVVKKQKNPLLLLQSLMRNKTLLEKIITCIADCVRYEIPSENLDKLLIMMETHTDEDSIIKKHILENIVRENLQSISSNYEEISSGIIDLCDQISIKSVNLGNFRTFCEFYKVYPEYINSKLPVPTRESKIIKESTNPKNPSRLEARNFKVQPPKVTVIGCKKVSVFKSFEKEELQRLRASYSTEIEKENPRPVFRTIKGKRSFNISEFHQEDELNEKKTFQIPRYHNKSVNFGFNQDTKIRQKKVHDVNFNYQLENYQFQKPAEINIMHNETIREKLAQTRRKSSIIDTTKSFTTKDAISQFSDSKVAAKFKKNNKLSLNVGEEDSLSKIERLNKRIIDRFNTNTHPSKLKVNDSNSNLPTKSLIFQECSPILSKFSPQRKFPVLKRKRYTIKHKSKPVASIKSSALDNIFVDSSQPINIPRTSYLQVEGSFISDNRTPPRPNKDIRRSMVLSYFIKKKKLDRLTKMPLRQAYC
ncbi:unnamed protein product [Moneuplotes crassus]|uniref:Uncharacterized protein n=1 Tax=Euplotes crassus TaxID=5936 RepID=A0AAD1Y7F8_EUPCR|nr:unnamed protein product [Moneuplotes crassus]